MGNSSISKSDSESGPPKPILIWIDKNVNNNENKEYKEKIINNLNYKIYSFDSVSKAIDFLKKIEFIKTYIICSGKAYIIFIKKFIENINKFMICPKIIIFTSDKKKYLEMNQNNNDLFLNHSFYNSGGIEDIYEEIEKFLKNEINIYNSQFDLSSNHDLIDMFPNAYKTNLNLPTKILQNINNIQNNQNYLIKNDELNSYKQSDSNLINNYQQKEANNKKIAQNNIINRQLRFDNSYDSVKFNFEYIPDKNYLILPIYLSFYIRKLQKKQIRQFNKYMLEKYSKEEKIVDLFKQINDMKDIPNEIISKYWARAYTLESPFYEEMNDDLRSGKINKYLSYIQMMYEGIKIKSFYFKPKKKLYRGTYFDEKEISIIQNYINSENNDLPRAIIYSKSFFSFSLNKKVAMTFIDNALLIIEDFIEEERNCSGCASIEKFSYFKKEEEILVFPFSSFEIKNKNLEKVEDKSKKNGYYYIIYLSYLGKYEKLFEKEDPVKLFENIPKDSLYAEEVFKTDIIEEEYKKKFKGKNFDNVPEEYINLDSQIDIPNAPMGNLNIQKEKKNINMNGQL